MPDKMESIKNNNNFLTFDIALSKKRKEVKDKLASSVKEEYKDRERISHEARLELKDSIKSKAEAAYSGLLPPSDEEINTEAEKMYEDYILKVKSENEIKINSQVANEMKADKKKSLEKFVENLVDKWFFKTEVENNLLKYLDSTSILNLDRDTILSQITKLYPSKKKGKTLDYSVVVDQMIGKIEADLGDTKAKELEYRNEYNKLNEKFQNRGYFQLTKDQLMNDFKSKILEGFKTKIQENIRKVTNDTLSESLQDFKYISKTPKYKECLKNFSELKLEFNNVNDDGITLVTRGSAGTVNQKSNGNLLLNLEGTNSQFKNLDLIDIKEVESSFGIKYMQEQIQVIEIDENGNEESYTILAPDINELGVKGISIVCSETSTFFEFGKVNNLSSTVRKPIIAFEGFDNTNIKIEVNYTGTFLIQYPKADFSIGNTATWVGKVQDNKFISQTNKSYPYIFWDGNGHNLSDNNIDKILIRANLVAKCDFETFLENCCNKASLNYQLSTDFITFWLPILENYEACYITILDYEECNSIATLAIDTDSTDYDLTRFYMVYKPLSADQINENLTTNNLDIEFDWYKDHKNSAKPKITEWGGFEL